MLCVAGGQACHAGCTCRSSQCKSVGQAVLEGPPWSSRPRPSTITLALLQAIDAELIVQAGAGGTVNASVAADDAAVNRFLLDLVRC